FTCPLLVTIVIDFIDGCLKNVNKSYSENPDCPGWLCNITIEFGLLLNNNSVACYPGTKDTLS
ncbi:hypothetical protein, partial [Staphylococcus aureus]